MKKIIKYFSLLLISAFLLTFFNSDPVSANYSRGKNSASVSAKKIERTDSDGKKVSKLGLRVEVKYQRGFDISQSNYYICRVDEGETVNSPSDCVNLVEDWKNYVHDYSQDDLISKESSSKADSNPTTKVFEVETGVTLLDTARDTKYVVFIKAIFCTVRAKNGDQFTGCQYWDNKEDINVNERFTKVEFLGKDVINKNINDIDNEELDTVMQKISDIVYNTIMPIIWVVLGVFLVVKGTLLGVQIVKAADEPQVRQEKIGSLKWLVIGVAIAALASGGVQFLTGFISGALEF